MRSKSCTNKKSDPLSIDELAIPARIFIGVTGHRKLENEAGLKLKIQEVLNQIKNRLPVLKNTRYESILISSLAEGADRIIAHETLNLPGFQLNAVLPFELEEYLKDFREPDSVNEIMEMISTADHVIQLNGEADRSLSYERAGRYVVDHCDILIAVWNGNAALGRGGTAEIVEYARKKKCPIFWINTEKDFEIRYEEGKGVDLKSYEKLDRFNAEKKDKKKIVCEIEKLKNNFLELGKKYGMPPDNLLLILTKLLPQFVQMDILAQRFQNLYYKAGGLVYSFAAFAVAVAAFQALFQSHHPRIILIEVVLIFAILLIYGFGSKRKWHSKWIDYRFLAERLRSALFMKVADIKIAALRPPRHLSLSYSYRDWMVSAFAFTWSRLQGIKCGTTGLKGLKEFILHAWIDHQIKYYKKTAESHYRRHRLLLIGGNVLFGMTLFAATVHIFHFWSETFNLSLAFIAIVFPAIASAMGAIRTHREYLRNAKRSSEMVRHLEEIKENMLETEDRTEFIQLVQEAEETMLHENEDWRVVVRFHELEPPA